MDKILNLLQHYNFELGFCTKNLKDNFSQDLSNNLDRILDQRWQNYHLDWIHLAVVEAIYQGRYKVASVDYILGFWQKRGVPICRFDREFERIICSEFCLPLPQKGIYPAIIKSTVIAPNFKPEAIATKSLANERKDKLNGKELVKGEHRAALQQMQLFAESSLFVDKLKSMCDPSLLSHPSSDVHLELSLQSSELEISLIND
jgi:hypothetical protein